MDNVSTCVETDRISDSLNIEQHQPHAKRKLVWTNEYDSFLPKHAKISKPHACIHKPTPLQTKHAPIWHQKNKSLCFNMISFKHPTTQSKHAGKKLALGSMHPFENILIVNEKSRASSVLLANKEENRKISRNLTQSSKIRNEITKEKDMKSETTSTTTLTTLIVKLPRVIRTSISIRELLN